MRFILWFAAIWIASGAFGQRSPAARAPVDQLIPWLLDEDQQLRGVPFSEVIFDTTGRKVLPFEANNSVDQRVAKAISAACDETMKRLNAPDSAIQNVDRINEVSSHFEDTLRELLNTTPGLQCDFPLTVDGKIQRSGYPDLRITDVESKRVFYLDPKLYAAGSRDSSFRTFYFEPKKSTNKVRDDAVHFVVGFEHAPRSVAASLSRGDLGGSNNTATQRRNHNSTWKFTRWDLVDLSRFTVKLKAEFQGSNHDMYRSEAIVASSAK
ncbi:MAG TPA: hypothetical protein VGG93_03460 [Candidatus Udaeobacter sp.]|jgi:hypothetical protein